MSQSEIWLKIFEMVFEYEQKTMSTLDWDEERCLDNLWERVIKRTNKIFTNANK